MPEMPEVEQVRKTLLPHIKGKTIKNIEINLARLIKYPSPEEFIAGLTGKTILDVGRRGKYLVLKTGENQKLIVHLRMTGSLIAQEAEKPAPPYAKIKFELTDGVTMWFCDIRTFGTLYLVTNDDAYIEGYETLGPEPLSEGFTAGYSQKQKAYKNSDFGADFYRRAGQHLRRRVPGVIRHFADAHGQHADGRRN